MTNISSNSSSPLPLQGKSGMTESDVPVQARRVLNHAKDVSHTELLASIKDNNLDEIVVEDAAGERFVLYADELAVSEGSLPKPGEQIEYGQVKGEVLFVDDEENEDKVTIGLPSLGEIGVGIQAVLTRESDEAIKAISIANLDTQFEGLPEDITNQDMMFALEVDTLTKNDQAISSDQLTRYTEIHQALLAQKMSEDAAVQDKLNQLDWLTQLRGKVETEGYTPTEQELTKLETLGEAFFYQYDRQTNSFQGVQPEDFQWVLNMESKVMNDAYRPTEQEQQRYQEIVATIVEFKAQK